LNWGNKYVPQFLTVRAYGKKYGQIRNRIGFDSEKRFNNSRFLKDSEVESKSATPYSSKRTREGPGKLRVLFPSLSPSADLDPSEFPRENRQCKQ
jgi:hypothetical protein